MLEPGAIEINYTHTHTQEIDYTESVLQGFLV